MLQFVIVGLVLGSIYTLAASGLVITYVSTGVLNFAFGSLAYFIARTYYWIHIEKGWGILPSAFLCLFVISPLLGLLLYMGIFRFLRFRRSSSKSSSPSGCSWRSHRSAT